VELVPDLLRDVRDQASDIEFAVHDQLCRDAGFDVASGAFDLDACLGLEPFDSLVLRGRESSEAC
jgi:hypothetical protein